jgi:pyroglutamyl-peptidase
MPVRRPVILLTGFGPFPGVADNISSRFVRHLEAEVARAFPGFGTLSEVIDTEWHAAPARAATLVRESQPVLALHFGVSRRARGFVLELRARNRASPLADAAGRSPPDVYLADDGPPLLAARLRAGLVIERLRRLRVPATLSRDAGSYLCNAVFYHSLRAMQASRSQIGFIHLPASLGIAKRTNGRSAPCLMSWDEAISGVLDIVAASLGRPRCLSPRGCRPAPDMRRKPDGRSRTHPSLARASSRAAR